MRVTLQLWAWALGLMISIGAAHGATEPAKLEPLEVTEGVEWAAVPKTGCRWNAQ